MYVALSPGSAQLFNVGASNIEMLGGAWVRGYTSYVCFWNVGFPELQQECFASILTYPTVTSNMLLPMELESAMSPNPFLATMTLVMRSGILVPAARNVKPIT